MFGWKEAAPPDRPGDPVKAANKIRADNSRIFAQLARDYLKERKSKRRWRLLFKGLVGIYVVVTVFLYFQPAGGILSPPHAALVEINGVIGSGQESSDRINQSLRRAFAAKDARGVIVRINSPGGSPVQAAEINAEIRRLKGAYPGKPLYAVISDVCASGGYYVAVAADEIYGNRSSLVGSIGVLLDGFGFVESMKKLGIERRLLTSGENKGMLDSFSPENESHRRHAQSVLHEVHRQFIYAVKQGRGARLADNEDIFSGLFWSGEQAKQLGLIDGFGSIDDVARDAVSVDEIVNYTVEFPWFDRFAGLVGASISRALTRNNFVLR